MVRRFLAGACAALALTLGACGAPPAVITPSATILPHQLRPPLVQQLHQPHQPPLRPPPLAIQQ